MAEVRCQEVTDGQEVHEGINARGPPLDKTTPSDRIQAASCACAKKMTSAAQRLLPQRQGAAIQYSSRALRAQRCSRPFGARLRKGQPYGLPSTARAPARTPAERGLARSAFLGLHPALRPLEHVVILYTLPDDALVDIHSDALLPYESRV